MSGAAVPNDPPGARPHDVTAYRHTQVGYLTIFLFAFVALTTVAIAMRAHRPTAYFILIPLVIVAVLFSTLTIEVRDGDVRSHFGPGFWRKRYPLSEIAAVARARSEWWEGWGIRVTSRGMLYNVSGTQAVELRLRSSTRFRLGTDEPDALLAALRNAGAAPAAGAQSSVGTATGASGA
jgi:hypothetical protein